MVRACGASEAPSVTMNSEVSELASRSVVPIRNAAPPEIAEWRRQRSPRRTRRQRARAFAAASRVAAPRAPRCEHLHDSTTRYDHDRKLLSFLLVCPVCDNERVMETRHYEPRFQPGPPSPLPDGSAGATIYVLPAPRDEPPPIAA
jgi:hypothetical protein